MASGKEKEQQKASIIESRVLNEPIKSASNHPNPPDLLHALQRNAGNQYFQAITPIAISSDRLRLQRGSGNSCNCALEGEMRPILQPKLVIGSPNDRYEQEADRVAQQVVEQIHSTRYQDSSQSQAVQRLEISEGDEEEEELQTKPETSILQHRMILREPEEKFLPKAESNILQRDELAEDDKGIIESLPEEEVCMKPTTKNADNLQLQRKSGEDRRITPPAVESVIQRMRSGGSSMPDNVRVPMEQAFGMDFSSVKIHANAQSDMLSHSLQAHAFTTGQDIFFRREDYNPGSRMGQELLAHELTHVVQQNSDKLQRKFRTEEKPRRKIIQQEKKQAIIGKSSTPEISILEGKTPENQVMRHLQTLQNYQNHSSTLYRQDIRKFQQENPTNQIVSSQQRVLESPKSVEIHQKDNSQVLRKCSCNPSPSPSPSFLRGQILAVNPNNTDGWIQGRIGSAGTVTAFPDYLKVEYQDRRGGRDYFEIKEGPYMGQTASLLPGFLDSSRSWGSAVSVTFNEDSSRSSSLQSEGTLDYGAGTVPAKIYVPGSVAKISTNRDYPLALPDAPHQGGNRYSDHFANTWFRIEGGPQQDEYLHRGDRSAGCVSVQGDWAPVYQHLINKRRDNQHIGTVRRVIIGPGP